MLEKLGTTIYLEMKQIHHHHQMDKIIVEIIFTLKAILTQWGISKTNQDLREMGAERRSQEITVNNTVMFKE